MVNEGRTTKEDDMPAYFDTGFTVRTPAWHGLATVLDEAPATTEEARQHAGLMWEPKVVPMFQRRRELVGMSETGEPVEADTYVEVPDGRLIVRDDTEAVIGRVGDGFTPVSNATMFELVEALADLYDVSQLFRARRAYAEAAGFPWAVLSALHGVVDPDQVLEPYDFSAKDMARRGDPRAWTNWVIQHAMRMVGRDGRVVLEVHAGIEYVRLLRDAAATFQNWSVEVIYPLEGLGIGSQLGWYKGYRHLPLEVAP